ncbi:hypothetical protein GCM10009825_22660 [Arthrobacter humicola]|uniref:Uncharacterized protein n=1 Tax=Arthrobacter humicola TaxID=409291 RepID=A0ABP5KYA5_9MICC
MEDPVRQQRQDGAFLAEGAADKRVDGDQEHELGQVLAQAQSERGPCGGAGLSAGVAVAHLAAARSGSQVGVAGASSKKGINVKELTTRSPSTPAETAVRWYSR